MYPSVLGGKKKRKKKVSRHIYKDNVSLVGREGKERRNTSPGPWWCEKSTLGETNLESFLLLSWLLVLKSEDQTLINISGKQTSGKALSHILDLRLQ